MPLPSSSSSVRRQGSPVQGGALQAVKSLPRKSARNQGCNGSSTRFLLGFLPRKWQYDGEIGEWLPMLSHVPVDNGVNGVRVRMGVDGMPNADTSSLSSLWGRKGGILLDPNDKRLGEYLNVVQMARDEARRPVFFTIFQNFKLIGQEAFWSHNADAFRKFQLLVVAAGIVPALDDDIRAVLLDRMRSEVGHIRTTVRNGQGSDNMPGQLKDAEALFWAASNGALVADWPGWSDDDRRRKELAPLDVAEVSESVVSELQAKNETLEARLAGLMSIVEDMAKDQKAAKAAAKKSAAKAGS